MGGGYRARMGADWGDAGEAAGGSGPLPRSIAHASNR